MRRRFGWMLVAVLALVGGLASCGSDDDGGDGGGGGSETTAAESGDDGGGGGNQAIADYCDSVQEFVDKSEELRADPTNTALQEEVRQLSTDLASEATTLAAEAPSFTAEDAKQFQDCQAQFGSGG